MKRKISEIKPDIIFKKGKLKIIARVIKKPLRCGESCPTFFSSSLVLLKPNWNLIPLTDGEINENSVHPLATAFKILGLSAFSIYGTSILIEVPFDQNPLMVAKEVVWLLIRCEENKELRSLVRLEGDFKILRYFLDLPDSEI